MRTLKRFVRAHVGGSFPVEAELTDGRSCVLKLRGTGNGERSLISEFIVNQMASGCQWAVPEVFPVELPAGFPWEFGTDEFDDLVQKSEGLNLGLQNLGSVTPLALEEAKSLPTNFLKRMVTLDALFANYDRTEMSLNLVRDGKGKVWMLDHGSCRILEKSVMEQPIALAPTHFLRASTGGLKIIQDIKNELREIVDLDRLGRAVQEVPAEWLREAGVSAGELQDRLALRFQRALLGDLSWD